MLYQSAVNNNQIAIKHAFSFSRFVEQFLLEKNYNTEMQNIIRSMQFDK